MKVLITKEYSYENVKTDLWILADGERGPQLIHNQDAYHSIA